MGSRTVLDVLDAEQELLNGRVGLVQAQHDEVVASFSLRSAVAFVTTPTMPRSFQARMLFEPIEPTSARGASSMTRAVPGRMSGVKGSGESVLYQWPDHSSYSSTSRIPAGGRWVGT